MEAQVVVLKYDLKAIHNYNVVIYLYNHVVLKYDLKAIHN